MWAALSLEIDKKLGFVGSERNIELNLSRDNWIKYDEVVLSDEFKAYIKSLQKAKPTKKRRR